MQNLNKYLIAIVTVTLINCFISIRFMRINKETYINHYKGIAEQNKILSNKLSKFYQHGIKVDVTMYQPDKIQCDDTPDITADGTRIRISKASEYKFVALSRNLLKRWGGPFNYGDFILLKGTSGKDGVYQVRDTMNAKWVNVVDILESKGVEPYKFTNVDIFKLDWIKENV